MSVGKENQNTVSDEVVIFENFNGKTLCVFADSSCVAFDHVEFAVEFFGKQSSNPSHTLLEKLNNIFCRP